MEKHLFNKVNLNISPRLCISLAAAVFPFILLTKGIYGSFLFTFSIPLLWQIGLTGQSIDSLGLSKNRIRPSIVVGLISGLAIGLLGGYVLKLGGISGNAYSGLDKLRLSFGSFNITFPLQKELGYQLLTRSGSFEGILIYLVFCIFAIGLGEELFWRGFIQRKISNYVTVKASIWLTAFLFASIHFYILLILPVKTGIFFIALIALLGAFLGYLFEHFNNIWPAAISHGTVAFIIWKYYFFTT
jgi:membrane protease YdiL (CAAX protease family)